MSLIKPVFYCLLIFACLPALSQERADTSEVAAPDDAGNRPIEQINITGERTLLSMRSAIQRLQEEAYRAFNELNNDDSLDIFCDTVARTASHIPTRVCEPVFLQQEKQQESREFIIGMRDSFDEEGINLAEFNNGMALLESESDIKQQLAGRYEALNQEMLRVAMKNGDYREMLLRLAKMKADYQAARTRRRNR